MRRTNDKYCTGRLALVWCAQPERRKMAASVYNKALAIFVCYKYVENNLNREVGGVQGDFENAPETITRTENGGNLPTRQGTRNKRASKVPCVSKLFREKKNSDRLKRTS